MPIKKQSASTIRIDLLPDLHENPQKSRLTIKATPKKKIVVSQVQAVVPPVEGNGWGEDFNELFSTIYDGALITTTSGHIIDANDRALKLLGYSAEELCAMNVIQFISCADEGLLDTIQESFENEKYVLIQAYCIRKDQSVFAAEISANLLNLSSRDCLCFFVRDTSLRESAEELRRQMQFIINRSHAVAFRMIPSEDMRIKFVSDSIEQYGYSAEELMDRHIPFSQLLHPADAEAAILQIRQQAEEGAEEVELECRVQTSAQDTHWIHLQGWFARNEQGLPLYVQGVFMDISERKHIEEERSLMEIRLRQAQKLESMGQLAAGIAHEINTPTQFVGDSVHFLQSSFNDICQMLQNYTTLLGHAKSEPALQDDVATMEKINEAADYEFLIEEIPCALERALKGIKRIADIVLAMKEFSHPGGSERSMMDVNKAIENAIIVAKNEWKYVAEMDLDLQDGLPLIRCIPGEINQVILNILVNAAQAIEEHLPDNPAHKGQICIRTHQQNDGDVGISIHDSGNGIPEDLQTRIFDPFFTTKDVGKGTGQGLTIAYNIVVNRHSGKLSFDSEPGKGTTFHIVLPQESSDNSDDNETVRPAVPGFV